MGEKREINKKNTVEKEEFENFQGSNDEKKYRVSSLRDEKKNIIEKIEGGIERFDEEEEERIEKERRKRQNGDLLPKRGGLPRFGGRDKILIYIRTRYGGPYLMGLYKFY